MAPSLQEQWKKTRALLQKSFAQVETLVGPQVAPPKSRGLKPRRKRENPIKVRLNESERELVRGKARSAEMSVNAFIKCLILDLDYDPHLRKLFLGLNRELTAQGRNFNQITKCVNNGTITTSEDLVMALDAIKVPLMRALYAVKAALAQTAPQP